MWRDEGRGSLMEQSTSSQTPSNSGAFETAAGLLVVYKPAGMTSRDVVNRVQRVTGNRKCGHAGTLDPLATGVLMMCLGRATRLVPYLQRMTKRYRATFRFGWKSNTDDIEGDLELVPDAVLPEREAVEAALRQMQGVVFQVPPQFSAVKVTGQRAYDLARQGQQVDLLPRPVQIHAMELVRYEKATWEVLIECGSGTYVRSIGRDIGQQLGCSAVMTDLCREAIGSFTCEAAVPLENLEADSWTRHLLPSAQAVCELPQYTCSPAEAQKLAYGQLLPVAQTFPAEEVAVLDEAGQLVAITAALPTGELKPRQVFCT